MLTAVEEVRSKCRRIRAAQAGRQHRQRHKPVTVDPVSSGGAFVQLVGTWQLVAVTLGIPSLSLSLAGTFMQQSVSGLPQVPRPPFPSSRSPVVCTCHLASHPKATPGRIHSISESSSYLPLHHVKQTTVPSEFNKHISLPR